MRIPKLIIAAAMALALAAQTALAAEDIMPFAPEETEPDYRQIKGIVTELRSYYDMNGNAVDGSYYVLIENDEHGGPVNFFVNEETVSITGAVPKEGDTFTGVLNGNMPAILIYPPQYTAVAYTVNLECSELFIPTDGNISVTVEGKTIETPAPFINDASMLMVPVRAIAEALGYEVTWEEDTESVFLNNVISFKVGEDAYNIGRAAPIKLGTAPVVANCRTYVPLKFFREVVKMNNAYFLEGAVEINNDEKME